MKDREQDIIGLDAALMHIEVKPFDLSRLKPFEALTFCVRPSVKVTKESLAQFMIMEGRDYPSAAVLFERMASFGKTENGQ